MTPNTDSKKKTKIIQEDANQTIKPISTFQIITNIF